MKKKYIATFQVKFDPDLICDEKQLQQTFGGSWDKCIEQAVKDDGIGLFDEPFEFIRVIK